MNDRSKVAEKAAKLKAHMESAKEMGSEEEAHAFATMMQRMMLEHELSEADVAAAEADRHAEAPITQRMVDYAKFNLKLKKRREAWTETMARMVSRAHLCKFLLRTGSNQIWFVGTAAHIDVAEFVFCQLVNAAQKMSKTAAYQYMLRAKREGAGRGAAAGYRVSWLNAFIQRLNERYADEFRHTTESYVPSGGVANSGQALMVVKTAMTRVQSYIDHDMGIGRGAKALSGRRERGSGAYAGRLDGHEAANRVALTPRKGIKS